MSSTAMATPLMPPLTAHVFLFPDEEPGAGTGLSAALGTAGAARMALSGVRRLPPGGPQGGGGRTGHGHERAPGHRSGRRDDPRLAQVLRPGRGSATDLDSRGTEEVVVLATHRVSSTYKPSVDVTIDSVKVNTFEFVLSVQIDIRGLSAVVRGGDLVALYGGDCLVTATLTLEGAELAHREKDGRSTGACPTATPRRTCGQDRDRGSEVRHLGQDARIIGGRIDGSTRAVAQLRDAGTATAPNP